MLRKTPLLHLSRWTGTIWSLTPRGMGPGVRAVLPSEMITSGTSMKGIQTCRVTARGHHIETSRLLNQRSLTKVVTEEGEEILGRAMLISAVANAGVTPSKRVLEGLARPGLVAVTVVVWKNIINLNAHQGKVGNLIARDHSKGVDANQVHRGWCLQHQEFRETLTSCC